MGNHVDKRPHQVGIKVHEIMSIARLNLFEEVLKYRHEDDEDFTQIPVTQVNHWNSM